MHRQNTPNHAPRTTPAEPTPTEPGRGHHWLMWLM